MAPLRSAACATRIDNYRKAGRLWRARVEPALEGYMGPIDFVARSLGGSSILVAECKWGTVDAHDELRLKTAGQALAKRLGVTDVHPVLFAARGPNEAHPPRTTPVFTPETMFEHIGKIG